MSLLGEQTTAMGIGFNLVLGLYLVLFFFFFWIREGVVLGLLVGIGLDCFFTFF